MNGKARLAWELYLKMETSGESFSLLQLIANDCYKMGHFYYAAKAFDMLERLDPNPEYWEGKRGAAIGLFQVRNKNIDEKTNFVFAYLFPFSPDDHCREGRETDSGGRGADAEEHVEPAGGAHHKGHQEVGEGQQGASVEKKLFDCRSENEHGT